MIKIAQIELEISVSSSFSLILLILSRLILPATAFTIIFTATINALLFPDCNRVTRDCFLINNFWVVEGNV